MADDLKGRTALVLGAGASGLTAVRHLANAGAVVLLTDDDPDSPGLDVGANHGAEIVSPDIAVDRAASVDVVVPSPGVPESAAAVAAALAAGVEVWSEPELGWRLYRRTTVAVTGTNGKTSVTELLTMMLNDAGIAAVSCGNIGRPYTEAASSGAEVLVAELSSFQLRFASSLAPRVALLLNVAPDHLDWHGGFTAYAAAKARIWEHQQAEDVAVIGADDPTARSLASTAPGRVVLTGAAEHATGAERVIIGTHIEVAMPEFTGTLLDLDAMTSRAPHHARNVAAAAAAALAMGADAESVRLTASSFRAGSHRLELVHAFGGVDFVDDSKATNAHAAAAALAAFENVIWVAGGLAKGVDLHVLAPDLDSVAAAVFIGEAADQLVELCDGLEIPCERASSIEAAVARAAVLARPGDTVLLAPACASFDQFSGYAERGDRFAAAARKVGAPESQEAVR